MKLPICKFRLLHSWGSATALSLSDTKMRMKDTKLIQIYLWVSIIILHPLYQWYDTKRSPWVVLYTHIAQLMAHTTNVYIAAAYLEIMLLNLLTCCRG